MKVNDSIQHYEVIMTSFSSTEDNCHFENLNQIFKVRSANDFMLECRISIVHDELNILYHR